MGLNFSHDLDAWGRWQRSRNRLRTVKAAMLKQPPADLVVLRWGTQPQILVALDAATPSALAAVLRPATLLDHERLAVLATRPVAERVISEHLLGSAPGAPAPTKVAVDTVASLPQHLAAVRVVISAGHFLPAGALAHRWATSAHMTYCVVQHGLLTPFAPPLPENAHLFAFSNADGEFWRSGRRDLSVEHAGSQLLWDASAAPQVQTDHEAPPVFLGQLHGAELRRRTSAATATQFCSENSATYRPHPAETDRLSRWQHRAWRRSGIQIEDAGLPLNPSRPTVAIFSTGVLEAAAGGAHTWVTCVRPPEWVKEFWQRYELAQWGEAPTAPPTQPEIEPSVYIAARVRELAEGSRGRR